MTDNGQAEVLEGRMERDESDEYVEKMRAALREAGGEGIALAERIRSYHKGWYKGMDDGWGPAIAWTMLEPTREQQDLMYRAAIVARVPAVKCEVCWRAEYGCAENNHANGCEKWGVA